MTLLEAGARLSDRYVIERELGAGGWGTVYVALDEANGQRVALKVLRSDPRALRDDLARFAREARAAGSLAHPNIVRVIDFHDEAAPPFLVMELLEGTTFGAVIRLGPVPIARVVQIALEVLAALDAAHTAGIVHRDIKPENVFLVADAGRTEVAKLLDFGIARLDDGAKLTMTGEILGTPAYMAPEQAAGRAVDTRADLYSLGATMYRALTGRTPFHGTDLPSLLTSIRQEDALPLRDLRPDVPVRLAAIIERAMQKEPDARFVSAAEMREELAGAGHIVLRPKTRRASRPTRRWPVLAAIAGSLLIVLVGLAAAVGARLASMSRVAVPVRATALPAPPSAIVAPPEPSPSVTSVPSASASAAPVARRRMGGAHPIARSGSSMNILDQDWVTRLMPAITACFAATEYDPPRHELVGYRGSVDPSGNVTNATRDDDMPAHPKLDRCVFAAILAMHFTPRPAPGSFTIVLDAAH